MRIRRKKINKKIVLIISAVLIIITASVLAYVYKHRQGQVSVNNSGIFNADTFEPTQSDIEQSEQLQNDMNGKKSSPNTDRPTNPTQSTNSTKQQITVSASVDKSSDTVYIRGGMNYPVQDGSCYAQLIGPSGQSIRKDTDLLQNPASTDCKTIAIPITDLNSGSWKFILHYSSDMYEGASSEVTFSI